MDGNPGIPTRNPQQDNAQKPYQEIVRKRLGISEEFFISHSETMLNRLRAVSKALTGLGSEPSSLPPRRGPGPGNISFHVQDIYEPDISQNLINICLHIASSVVLLESKAVDLSSALDSVAKEFPKVDASMVLTAATLYYIMHDYGEALNANGDLQTIHKHFDQMEWLIGRTAMDKLGIESLKARAQAQGVTPRC